MFIDGVKLFYKTLSTLCKEGFGFYLGWLMLFFYGDRYLYIHPWPD
ncbi:hypothetical protein SAMN04488522_102514 [Pedobacter caeni]|uniref:Uncharacterized protein n=1 Tax=Pedobacter caeni TaxID=288992 RepID=A0A1M4ZY75_9SPHI|nr:hypothetical protein SAMN04488522_102514 [Pedobacter caeni]